MDNAGPQDATGVSLTDTLPSGVTFDSATASQGSCSESGGTVTCDLGTIANGAGASVEIKVVPREGGTITNQASISSEVGDADPADNSANAETTIDPVADLSLTKTDSPDPVLSGEELTYTLDVHNAGPSSATGVLLSDTLPAGVVAQSVEASQGTCGAPGSTVGCTIGTLADGASATVTIKVTTGAPGTITNQASVSSFVNDPDLVNNDATADTTVDPAANLSLTKTDSPDPAVAGELLTYTLTVQNAGPQDATGVQVSDQLPAGATFDSANPSQGTCAEASGTVDCALGTVANGGSASVEIKVTPQGAGVLTNDASVSSDLGDPDNADNSASAQTTVNGVADLVLSKSDSPDPVLVGELLTYSLTVQNAGPQEATGVQLIDELPAGVAFESATASQGSCSEAAGTVTCVIGTLNDQESATVEIKVRPSSAGTITNNAGVASDAHDPTTSNNDASAETTVDPAADLAVTKTDSPDPVLAGELVAYTVSVHNAGPSSATGVTVTDTLPAGVTFSSASASQGTCTESGGTVTCALGTLADEESASISIAAATQSAGSITNEAAVSSDVADPVSSNDSDSEQTNVVATAPGYPRPKGATPLATSLVPAYAECTAPNSTHGTPLNSQSCTPPVLSSSYLTTGTPDANGLGTRMAGNVQLITRLGNSGTPADEADVRIVMSITDVRRQSDLTDYTGELEGRLSLQITDRVNGATGRDTGTVTTSPFAFAVPCTATGGTVNQGATCAIDTTADALMPGVILEDRRTVWEVDDVKIFDGGADGQAATPDNTLFLRQGVFVP